MENIDPKISLLDKQQREKAKNIIKDVPNMTQVQKQAYGCVLGAFIADALGSFHEFSSKDEAEKKIDFAMQLPGMGTFDSNPAQLTDDSELALSQAYGIIKGKGKLDIDLIAAYYGFWMKSNPFDRGITMSSAFYGLKGDSNMESGNKQAQRVRNAAFQSNKKSQSNGSLMKITPLALFTHKLQNQKDVLECVYQDIILTHPDYTVVLVSYIWVKALNDLINSQSQNIQEKAKEAYQNAENYLKLENDPQISQIQEWWSQEVKSENFKDATKQQGWVRIAWTYGFIILKQIAENTFKITHPQETLYENVQRNILSRGGDTDTNGCIVGGMIGALVGIEGIPQKYLEKVLSCNVISDYIDPEDEKSIVKTVNIRPIEYQPYNGILIVQQILDIAPTQLQLQ